MHEEQIEAVLGAVRGATIAQLKDLLRNATPEVLQKVAVAIVPPLMRVASYEGSPLGTGPNYAEAVARSRVTGLPPVLVRLHRGGFDAEDGLNVIASLNDAQSTQVAIAFIADRPVNPAPYIGARSHWTLDLDGLANLMINAGVGVTPRTFEAKFVDALYFR
ncbi:MAG TPA: hypothetical protein VND45_07605 [Thermoanaerobaculia bacterium]|jgi:hypothetical protein|nr:hypothetical protein [Thermoanaerobaculia bacterium]